MKKHPRSKNWEKMYTGWCFFTAATFSVVYGCAPGPGASAPPLRESTSSFTQKGTDLARLTAAHQRLLREIHTFPPQERGAIALEIGDSKAKTVSFGKVGQAYHVNSTSEAIWSHTFVKDAEPLDTSEDFELAETDLRYQLVVPISPNAQDSSLLSLWVNGVRVLDRVRLNQLHELPLQGLRKQNTIRVALEGEESLQVTLELNPAGAAGEVLRRQGDKLVERVTPATSAPSLDPDQLIQSGMLPVTPGNRNQQIPETQVADISLNLHAPEEVATGQVYIQVAEPEEENIAAIVQEYNAVILQRPIGEPHFYLIQPDLRKVDLDRLEAQLRQLNGNQPDVYLKIQRARFGNLESARTFAFAIAMISDPRVESVGLNPILQASTDPVCTALPTYARTPSTLEGRYNICINSHNKVCAETQSFTELQNFWWLNENSTHANRAWQYSQGYSERLGRPIKVAVIDQGFAGLKALTQAGQDLAGRVLLNEGGAIQMSPTDPLNIQAGSVQPFNDALLNQMDQTYQADLNNPSSDLAIDFHGTEVISTIAANYNDGQGVIGVAPQAQVLPFLVGYGGSGSLWSEVIAAIKIAAERQVNAINISMNSRDMDVYLKGYFETLSKNSWIAPAQALIHSLSERGIPIIVSAGNFGWPSIYTLPGKLYFPEIISVGALTQANSGPQDISLEIERHFINGEIKQFCSPISSNYRQNFELPHAESLRRFVDENVMSPYKMRVGSNYGDTSVIDIWAPGDNMLGDGPFQHSSQGSNPTLYSYWPWNATSAAAPMVTGTVALMKSLNPNLSVEDIRHAMQSTAEQWTFEDPYRRTLPFLDRSLLAPSNKQSAECGKIKVEAVDVFYNCGMLLTANEDRKQRFLSLRIDRALEKLPGIAAEAIKAKTLYGTILNGQFSTLGLSFDVLASKPQPVMYGENVVKGEEVAPGDSSYSNHFFSHFFQLLPGPLLPLDPNRPLDLGSACTDTVGCDRLARKWQDLRFKTIEQLVQNAKPGEPFRVQVMLSQGAPRLLSLEKLASTQVTGPKRNVETGHFCRQSDRWDFDDCRNPANPYDPGAAVITWHAEPDDQGQLCIKIDSCPGMGGPSPVPSFDPSAQPAPPFDPPGNFSAPVVISEPGKASNIRPITGSQPKSILRDGPFASYAVNILGNNATAGPLPAAQWVSLVDPSQWVEVIYPQVPNTVDFNNPAELHYLRILLQVKNQGNGGQVYVDAGGAIRTEKFGPGTRYPDGELAPIVFDFIESAKETESSLVRIRIENAQPGVQVIYKLFGIPKK